MFAMRHEFDHLVPGKDPYVFASEYAVRKIPLLILCLLIVVLSSVSPVPS